MPKKVARPAQRRCDLHQQTVCREAAGNHLLPSGADESLSSLDFLPTGSLKRIFKPDCRAQGCSRGSGHDRWLILNFSPGLPGLPGALTGQERPLCQGYYSGTLFWAPRMVTSDGSRGDQPKRCRFLIRPSVSSSP